MFVERYSCGKCAESDGGLDGCKNGAVNRVALVGQPNVGKTSLFNALSGLHQKVGNWPGKTIDKNVGYFCVDDQQLELIDLPGSYSLSACSEEEQVTVNFLETETPAFAIVVGDATAVERALYFISELALLEIPSLLVLNMADVARRCGVEVDIRGLERRLGIPVIQLSSRNSSDIERLKNRLVAYIKEGPKVPQFSYHDLEIKAAIQEMEATGKVSKKPNLGSAFYAWKFLEGETNSEPKLATSSESGIGDPREMRFRLAASRFEWIDRIANEVLLKNGADHSSITDKVDNVVLSPVVGLALACGILGLIYWVVFTLASPVQEFLDHQVLEKLKGGVTALLGTSYPVVTSCLNDGLLNGVGIVVTFIPMLWLFFVALAVLEDSGYLARFAYVLDRYMRLIGLHGKSSLPLVIGLGCNVAAVMGARVIEGKESRMRMIALASLIPCSARFAVVAYLVPVFFPNHGPLIAVALVAFNFIVLVGAGLSMRLMRPVKKELGLIMELPHYHVPSLKTVLRTAWNNELAFIKNAGFLILICSLGIWGLSTFPGDNIETSFIGMVGRVFEPYLGFVGLDWKLFVSLITSFVAKENALATLGVLYGQADSGELRAVIASAINPASALAFLVASMLFIPCASTLGAIYRETRSWLYVGRIFLFYFCMSMVCSGLVFHLLKAFGL